MLLSSWSIAQYWERTYGGADSDQGRGVVELPDGRFVVAGATGSYGSGGDIYVLGLGANGAIQWSIAHGGPSVEQGRAIATSEDALLVCGITNGQGAGGYDMLALKLDHNGTVLWERTYGTEDWDLGYAVARGMDGWLLAGQTFGRGVNGDAWLLRLDEEGDTLWTVQIGGEGTDQALSVAALSDGGWVACGSRDMGMGQRAFVARLLDDGTVDWIEGLDSDSVEVAQGVAVAANGDILFTGYSHALSTKRMMLLGRFSIDGEFLWREYYGQVDDFEAFSVRERADGGLSAVGYNKAFGQGGKDIYLLRTDQNGGFEQGLTFGSSEDDVAYAIERTADNGFIFCGTTSGYGPGAEAVHVVRTNAQGSTEGAPVIVQWDPLRVAGYQPALVAMSPVPVASGGELRWSEHSGDWSMWQLFNLAGVWVAAAAVSPNGSSLTVPTLPAGAYILQLTGRSGMRGYARIVVTSP